MSKVQCPSSKWKKSCLPSKAGSSWEPHPEEMCPLLSTLLTCTWTRTTPAWCQCPSGLYTLTSICTLGVLTITCTIRSTRTWCTNMRTTPIKCTMDPRPPTPVAILITTTMIVTRHIILNCRHIWPTGLDHSTTLASRIQPCSLNTSRPFQVLIFWASSSIISICKQLRLNGTETSRSSWTIPTLLRHKNFLEEETRDQLNLKVRRTTVRGSLIIWKQRSIALLISL